MGRSSICVAVQHVDNVLHVDIRTHNVNNHQPRYGATVLVSNCLDDIWQLHVRVGDHVSNPDHSLLVMHTYITI